MVENLNPQAPQQPQQPVQAPTPQPQNPGFMPPGSQSPQGMPTGNSSGPNKNALVAVVVAVIFFVSVVGYGFWNGSQVKAYAERADEIVSEIEKRVDVLEASDFDSFDIEQFMGSGSYSSELEKMKKDIDEFSKEVDVYYSEVAEKSVPGKASSLGKNLKEYTELAKELSDSSKYGVQIMEATIDIVDDMYNLDYSGYTEEEIMSQMEDVMKEWLDRLEKVTPPGNLKETHDKLVEVVRKAVEAFEQGDYDVFNDLDNPFDGLEEISKNFTEKEDRIKILKDEILKEASELKKTSFVLF